MGLLIEDLTEIINTKLHRGAENGATDEEMVDLTEEMVDFFENKGFSLDGNGWIEAGIKDWFMELIRRHNQSARVIALHTLRLMEDKGFSLDGNGWIDGEAQADIDFILEETDIIVNPFG